MGSKEPPIITWGDQIGIACAISIRLLLVVKQTAASN